MQLIKNIQHITAFKKNNPNTDHLKNLNKEEKFLIFAYREGYLKVLMKTAWQSICSAAP